MRKSVSTGRGFDGQMRRFDLHIHSSHSYDGVIEPEEIVKTARQRGLDGIAITDHDTIKGGREGKKYETEEFQVIIGSEIMTKRGEILGLFLNTGISSNDPQEVMQEIKAQNGVVVVPHPFDKLRMGRFPIKEVDLEYIDCLEVFNARCIFPEYNEKANTFAIEHRLGMTAGSDAHLKREIGHAGIKINNDNIRNAIVQGNAEVFGETSSPFTHIKTKLDHWLKKLK